MTNWSYLSKGRTFHDMKSLLRNRVYDCNRVQTRSSFIRKHNYATFNYNSSKITEKKSRKTLIYLTGLVVAMVGSSYAAVPLYRCFCQATGYGGTIQHREIRLRGIVMMEPLLQGRLWCNVADGLLWKFLPTQREVRVKPGESTLAFYTAENRSKTPITGVSTYNVTPMKEQRLLPGEQIDMPVFFYIDPEFETDPRMDGINNIILSYTFFKVPDE